MSNVVYFIVRFCILLAEPDSSTTNRYQLNFLDTRANIDRKILIKFTLTNTSHDFHVEIGYVTFFFCPAPSSPLFPPLTSHAFQVIITCVPFTSFLYTIESWPWGLAVCKLSECAKDISIGVSVFTLTALSAER